MKYFDIDTIKSSIESLQSYAANWLLPTFVFASNDVGTDEFVDMSKKLGTDHFLDRYFNGSRLKIPPTERGNNLLRPRLKGIQWNQGEFAGDYIIRQDTKMWGNLFSSRGYREMRLQGIIEGEKSVVKLTEEFKPKFEEKISDTFQFEDLLVWIYAFEGIPDEINSWEKLMSHFLETELGLSDFKPPYKSRFKLSDHKVPWPSFLSERPSNEEYLSELAPKLLAHLNLKASYGETKKAESEETTLTEDDPVYSTILGAMHAKESFSFLLAGPPGTGKTSYARKLATTITAGEKDQTLFLQFHPAIGYDDFIEGFRPAESSDGKGVTYKLEPRLFLNFSEKASKNPGKTYVAVIDELNRGDIARVFGEVLTYLEVDYRGQHFTLPFSGNSAHLPENLVVIATANPYDRSVTELDDALLRRFWVVDLEPSEAILKEKLQSNHVPSDVISRTVHLFNILNEVFPHGFGHTNFLKVKSVEDLNEVWSGRVSLPLKRALIHDKATFDATKAKIEEVITVQPEEDEETEEEGVENG
ncbi:AAA family ATPase [Halomonas sp. H33-56]|uniref:McrB family protein n=1 Tax=Halomonas sp. H33-56 TaxID=2950873 RepID=UPI0032DFAD72